MKLIQLDLYDHRPLYEQIKDKIKELIISGALKADEQIPSVREMAQRLTINPNTIQRAYKDLETDGYIYSVRAKGSFVSSGSHIIEKTENVTFMEEFETLLKQVKFLKVSKEKVIDMVNKIYKEGK